MNKRWMITTVVLFLTFISFIYLTRFQVSTERQLSWMRVGVYIHEGRKGVVYFHCHESRIEEAVKLVDEWIKEEQPTTLHIRVLDPLGDHAVAEISKGLDFDEFSIHSRRVTSTGVLALSDELRLRVVRVHSPPVDDNALGAFSKLADLELLDICFTSISTICVPALVDKKSLHVIFTDGSRVSEEEKKRFRILRPDVSL